MKRRIKPSVLSRARLVGLILVGLASIFGGRVLADEFDKSFASSPEIGNAESDYRQPIDLQLSPDEKRLAVACKKTGSILVVDLSSRSIVQRLVLGEELVDLESIAPDRLACVDHSKNCVYVCKWHEGSLQLETSFPTSLAPVRAEWVPLESVLRVACLWSRRLESFAFSDVELAVERISTWDLPIAPRAIKSLPDRQAILIADAFTPQLCVLRATDGQVLRTHSMYGHAITNIESDAPNEIVMLHPMLNDFAQTNQNDIHWGVLMANDLRWVQTKCLLEGRGDEIYEGGRVHPVGIPGNGAGEPTSLSVGHDAYLAVTVGGTNQVAIGRRDGYTFTYVDVGRYPVSSVISGDGLRCFIANQFDDSICVVDLKEAKLSSTILLGAIRPLSDPERGERLFHSAEFSHDRWMTCASCHVEGHTNGLLNDNLGDRNYGAPKRVLTLLGIRETHPYSWLGHEATIEKQVARSVLKTMQSYRTIDPDEMKQLAEYCESLEAPPSIRHARGIPDDELTRTGQSLFSSRGCSDCHVPPKFTSPDIYDVGLKDEKGVTQFNPPSLRGVSQRGPVYFHDNRAEGFRDVLVKHPRKSGQPPLSEEETAALVAYLESL